ncbi:MAG: alanine--tRNA ligase [Dehalococcoidia bacterium]|nr:alanine--tRNA ligase [Dehalococcoidia bacterium]
MDAHELRETFLRFFEERGHRRLPGAPIVPPGDPTLLFTSAGMVQFKPYFLGQSKPPHSRLTTVQKCFRTSDIESVGDTSHLTFFEMLGNFSVGDYFKAEVIPWAWEFVTKVLKLDAGRLWPAVYLDDDESYELWRQAGVPEGRIRRYGEEHNYWFSGAVGPCGPCSEIYYDFGEQFCPSGEGCEPSHDCGRFLEIWNLVFMSFYCDGEKRTPLPSRNIDTGSGLERVASVLLFESPEWDRSRLPSVYDTELFRPIIAKIEELCGKRYGDNDATDRAMRIVAEHARAVTFLVGDERTPVVPSNEERGYVARRLLRRAVYFARRQLGIEQPVMTELAQVVIETMAESHPELERTRAFVLDILEPEERRFDETLSRGVELLDEVLSRQQPGERLCGADVFLLHDTYGFPIELTREIAAEHGFTVDEAGFEQEMERQRERARAHAGGAGEVAADALYASLAPEATLFLGYETLEAQSKVVALVSARPTSASGRAGRDVQAETKSGTGAGAQQAGVPAPLQIAEAPAEVEVFIAETPFYPEGGGQVGDRGEIAGPHGRLVVEDTRRVAERLIVHRGRVSEGRIAVGDEVTARVDPQHRADTMRNHTATHLLHAALRQVLGAHVRQAGSLVAPDHLRFDFTHTEAVTAEQLAEVESLVNEKVRQDLAVQTRTTSFDEALSGGALAFFGDKYGEEVRVVEVNSVVPRFSAELCGGTHCHHTGEIGMVVITGESSIGSGMRRIEALTGRGAEDYVRRQRRDVDEIARRLGAPRDALAAKVEALLAEADALRKRIEKMERSLASAPATGRLLESAESVDGVAVLAARVEATSVDALRYVADALRKEMASGVAVLAAEVEGAPQFIAIVSQDLLGRGVHAGKLVKLVASLAGGGGGGRPDMAQGGGKDAAKIDEALAAVPDAVRHMLGAGRG